MENLVLRARFVLHGGLP